MPNVKLMIVEDEEIVAFDIESTLKDLGYEVCAVVASGEEAIASASINYPDLVLMDIMLKGSMDGIQTAEKIYKRFNIPVVYLTAYGDFMTVERAKASEPFGYIFKPFEEKELHTAVAIALSRHDAEKRIRQALEKEKELNKLKSLFVAHASHEFRTPLSTIRASIQLLELYCQELLDSQKIKHFNRIQTAIDQMLRLLDDLLVIGQAEAGRLNFNPVSLNLVDFCHNLVENLPLNVKIHYELHTNNSPLDVNPNSLGITKSGASIRQIISGQNGIQAIPEAPKQITFTYKGDFTNACMDEDLLQQILNNLLSNAIKYSPEGGMISFDISCEAEIVTFRIQDRGIGIALEDQQQLFEPFYRARNVGKIKGTGLVFLLLKSV
jgi:signal transduction histidine kinase